MSPSPALRRAIALFHELGFDSAPWDEIPTLDAGSPEQRRVAREGLARGDWSRWEENPPGTHRVVSDIGEVDHGRLAAFGIRAGISARRAADVAYGVPDDVRFALIADRGASFAAQYVAALSTGSEREFAHDPSGSALLLVRLVEEMDLEIPSQLDYLLDWMAVAACALAPEDDLVEELGAMPSQAIVSRRFTGHLRLAAELRVPATGYLPTVIAHGLSAGLLPRDDGIGIALTGLDSAPRPGDRAAWARLLVGPLALTGDEAAAHADALVPILMTGEAPLVEGLGVLLAGSLPTGHLGDLALVAEAARTKKARRALETALAERGVAADPGGSVDGTTPAEADELLPWVLPASPAPDGVRFTSRGAMELLGRLRDQPSDPRVDEFDTVRDVYERGLLAHGEIRVADLDEGRPERLGAFARALAELAPLGPLPLVWSLLDDVLGTSAASVRVLPGTIDAVRAVARLLPSVRAAVDAGAAPAAALDLPGLRGLAARSGRAEAVLEARALAETLPPRPDTPEGHASAATGPSVPLFEGPWPALDGLPPRTPIDDAELTILPGDPVERRGVEIRLPDHPGVCFTSRVGWASGLRGRGFEVSDVRVDPGAAWDGASTAALAWDDDTGTLRAWTLNPCTGSPPRPTPDPGFRRPQLSSTLITVLLAAATGEFGTEILEEAAARRLFAPVAVTRGLPALLEVHRVNPARLLRALESRPALLAIGWPILVETIRVASRAPEALPPWTSRALALALRYRRVLADAAERGLVPAEAAQFPGHEIIARRKGSSAAVRRARDLRDLIG